MSLSRRAGLIAAWAISLVLVGIFASAQAPLPQPPIRDTFPPLNAPKIIAGNDLGFRVESTRDGIPVGKLVVRVDGKWVEAQLGGVAVVPTGGR
jgi:hypothetical protein